MSKTNTQYKPGDKVYLRPKQYSDMTHYIRATVEKPNDKVGYLLRAFREDCHGIHMFNYWDHEILPREGKAKKKFDGYYKELDNEEVS